MPTADVVVVGAGVIGLSVAWRAAQRGLAVAVVDEEPGGGASWAAAGLLAPVTEAHFGEEALLQLGLESSRRYAAFVEELEEASGRTCGYRRSGTLVVARDADDHGVLAQLHAFQERLGLDVERVSSRECRALEPALSPRIRSGLHVRGDHQVDNRALVTALLVAVERAGVQLRRLAVTRVVVEGDRVRGVETREGRIDAGTVVVAAGAASRDVSGLPPAALVPVRPVKGQLLHLRARTATPPLRANVRGLDVYLVPRADGRIVVGATVEEQGDDRTPTAGGVRVLLRDAAELVPELDECAFDEVVVGSRPGTPDNAPVLGPGAVDGLVWATGHYRNGILLTPVTADAVAALLADGALPAFAAPFTPRRFSNAAGDGPRTPEWAA